MMTFMIASHYGETGLMIISLLLKHECEQYIYLIFTRAVHRGHNI